METNLLPWLCENLELPMFRETAEGAIEANGPAQDLVGGHLPRQLVTCARRAMGDDSDSERLAEGLLKARQGHPEMVEGPRGQRAIFVPAGPARAAVMVAPAAFADIALLQQRAAATERTAGVSHELANALGAIAGWARLARSGERVSEALELIERSAESAWATARHFLFEAGSQADSEGQKRTDLTALCQEVGRLVVPKATLASVRIDTDLTPGLMAAADRGALWSVLWNLVSNGIEAMPDGGSLSISLSATDDELLLMVSDTGTGMPESVRRRIFEPYYTTKTSGAGIGLSVVRRTVESFGGNIAVHSTEGVGTRFEVWIPRAAAAPLPQRTGKRASGVFVTEHLDGHYLVVDDDAILREMVATALQMRGATVTAVGSAEEALEQRGPFVTAVVDLLLSGTRGDHLSALLRRKGIVDRILLVTGTELPADVPEDGAPDAVLRKPFDLDAMYDILQTLAGHRTDRKSHSA